jgi:hypothetical protein
MALDFDQTVGLIQEDLAPLKINVSLEIQDHIYFIKFVYCFAEEDTDYWQNYWGMDFSHFVGMWMRRYFRTPELSSQTKNSAVFRLGSLLDFLRHSENDL